MSGYKKWTSAPDPLSGVPKMRDLYRLVIKRVAHKWEELCISFALDDDGAQLLAIRRDHIQHGVEKCCLHAILHWLKGEGKTPVCWNTMITCLKEIEQYRDARDIQEALSGM